MKLNERQYYMLKDFASYNYKKYPYRAMPEHEIQCRDFRTIHALLRKGLIEYPPMHRDHNGLPCEYEYYSLRIRITQTGIEYLQNNKGI